MKILEYASKFLGYLLSCIVICTLMPIETCIYYFMKEMLSVEFDKSFNPLFGRIVDWITNKAHWYERKT